MRYKQMHYKAVRAGVAVYYIPGAVHSFLMMVLQINQIALIQGQLKYHWKPL